MRWSVAGVVLAMMTVAGCQAQPDPAPAAPEVSSASGSPSATALPGGLAMTCRGSGTPTVVLVPGLGADQSAFAGLAAALPTTPTVCTTERAGSAPALPWRPAYPTPRRATPPTSC